MNIKEQKYTDTLLSISANILRVLVYASIAQLIVYASAMVIAISISPNLQVINNHIALITTFFHGESLKILASFFFIGLFYKALLIAADVLEFEFGRVLQKKSARGVAAGTGYIGKGTIGIKSNNRVHEES